MERFARGGQSEALSPVSTAGAWLNCDLKGKANLSKREKHVMLRTSVTCRTVDGKTRFPHSS